MAKGGCDGRQHNVQNSEQATLSCAKTAGRTLFDAGLSEGAAAPVCNMGGVINGLMIGRKPGPKWPVRPILLRLLSNGGATSLVLSLDRCAAAEVDASA